MRAYLRGCFLAALLLAGCLGTGAEGETISLTVEKVPVEQYPPDEVADTLNITSAHVARFPPEVRALWEKAIVAGEGSGVVRNSDVLAMDAVLDEVAAAQGVEWPSHYLLDGVVYRVSMMTR